MNLHAHRRTPEIFVFWIPADSSVPMELKLIPNTLQAMQQYVGGYIERVHTAVMPELACGCPMVMMVNEDGLARQLPFNPRATAYYPYANGIVGDAILMGEGLVAPDPKSHSYEPGDEAEPDAFSLPTNFHTWEGPGHPIPVTVGAREG